MELEVSKKVREAIKAKLVELGCHVDDELPDYIMILIANRRSNQEIESDLGLFLTDNTKKFVTWLTHVLKKLEQVTACETVPTAESKEAVVPPDEEEGGEGKGRDKNDGDGKKGKKAVKLKRRHSSNKDKESDRKDKKSEKKEKSFQKKEKDEERTEKKKGVEMIEKDFEKKEKGSETTEKDSSTTEENRSSGNDRTRRDSGVSNTDKEPVFNKKKVTIQRNDPVKASTVSKENELKTIGDSVQPDTEDKNHQDTVPVDAVDDMHSGHDTLILDTGENEFSENVEELRRIALESQQRKRKIKEDIERSSKGAEQSSKNVHQRQLITTILMSQSRVNEEKDLSNSTRNTIRSIPSEDKRSNRSSDKTSESYTRTRRSSRNSPPSKSGRHEKSPISFSRRVLRSPRRQERRSVERHLEGHHSYNGKHNDRERRSEKSPVSVFRRIGSSVRKSATRSRTRSRSPVRKLTSKIGNVIRRSRSSSADESLNKNSVCSVIKVTERPRRDIHLTNKMLLRAVADAQQSIIKTEQNSPTAKPKPEGKVPDAVIIRDQSRKRMSDENMQHFEVVSNKRRFTDFPEVNTNEFYEQADPATRRSVKERLGVKRDIRRPVRERLGLITTHSPSPMHVYENETYSPGGDYKIMINVSDEPSAINGKQRNVVLAANNSKRISIQVNNNSEEDDSSTDGSLTSTEESPKKREDSTNITRKGKNPYETEFQLAISDEDKLPEVPMDSDQEVYEYEEIIEEEDLKENEGENAMDLDPETETPQNLSQLSQASTVDSQKNFSITINKRPTQAPVTALKSNLPDLRTMMSSTVPFIAVNGSVGGSGLKCKFWPKCQFKDKCIYEHPACKFSPCKNIGCIYKHDNFVKHETFETKPKSSTKPVCKFYPKCTSMNCKFHHPSPCRFGVGCTDPRCENYHPGVTLGIQKLKAKGVKLLPKANQLKWVKK